MDKEIDCTNNSKTSKLVAKVKKGHTTEGMLIGEPPVINSHGIYHVFAINTTGNSHPGEGTYECPAIAISALSKAGCKRVFHKIKTEGAIQNLKSPHNSPLLIIRKKIDGTEKFVY